MWIEKVFFGSLQLMKGRLVMYGVCLINNISNKYSYNIIQICGGWEPAGFSPWGRKC